MFETMNSEQIESLLHHQIIGRIGSHADETTYVVPISYVYDGESIYCRTFEGLKLRMMRKNPRVCFQVDDTSNMANWQSVICWGDFEELHDTPARDHALKLLMEREIPAVHSQTMQLTPQWPFPSGDSTNIKGLFFRIRIVQKTGRFEKGSAGNFFAS